ncbi:hypothetical protein CPB86DRAFT_824306 [Serendipita vermifera]|nr:hypothetical protein CPB86DRAFT_824306 [Serendipita vermifera]
MVDTAIALEELVTSIPVQKLYNEFHELSHFYQYFITITTMMFIKLKDDKCGNRLRSLLFAFNRYMHIVINEIDDALMDARGYYVDGPEEREALAKINTKDDVQSFLDAISRKKSAVYGQEIIAALEEAVPILKDNAFPLLEDIKMELQSYVKNYQERRSLSQRRSQSWLPFAVQDLVWGGLEEITRDVSGIEVLPETLNNGIQYLQRIPNFVENLKHHFQLMMTITQTDYESLGYSSLEGFKRLHENRLQCSSLLLDMARTGSDLPEPFAMTRNFELDDDVLPSSDNHKYI